MFNSQSISTLIQGGVSDGIFPGAVAYVIENGENAYYEAFGHRMVEPTHKLMERDTVFDLASLTKPIVVATLVLRLVEDNRLEVNAPVQSELPEFIHPQVTLLHLLTHTSGLPAWSPTYLDAESKDAVVRYIGGLPLEYPTGEKVVYSCLGYILLGKLIERVTGESLDGLAQDSIFRPLGMCKTRYNPPQAWHDECAATEDSNSFEKRMVNYRRYDWRENVIVGEVHDENAHFLGGVSGNAGLFSTAEDLGKFCQMLFGGGTGVLKPERIEQLATVYTDGLDASRGIGWIILDDGSLYHTGFTGTSMRINLERKMAAILLTNRVHPDASRLGIIEFRNQFYRCVFEG
jgi:CubicO group peptidase (beta-lactamase class C family)